MRHTSEHILVLLFMGWKVANQLPLTGSEMAEVHLKLSPAECNDLRDAVDTITEKMLEALA